MTEHKIPKAHANISIFLKFPVSKYAIAGGPDKNAITRIAPTDSNETTVVSDTPLIKK